MGGITIEFTEQIEVEDFNANFSLDKVYEYIIISISISKYLFA